MYAVIENTPGYLPDSDDPLVTDVYAEAVAEANRLADELEEEGYQVDRGWASQDNLFACYASKSGRDLGRYIEVILCEFEGAVA